jgi:hypothetical protein
MRLTDDMLTHSSAPWMWRPIVECIGARFFIDPFRVDARRDGVMVVVMLHNPACRHLSLHDPWWRHSALDVLTLAIARAVKVGGEGWRGKCRLWRWLCRLTHGEEQTSKRIVASTWRH